MKNFARINRGLLITLILSVLFLFGFYGEVLLNPNDYIFAPTGDGIKNYFTYMYHIKNDVDIHHFSGMNYPYGDLHILTDGHTLLSSILQFIPGAENWGIGLLNLLILLSFPFTGCVVFKLLKSFNLIDTVAIVFALSIMMLSPQYTRMLGHISMSYSFFIPLTWYWVRQFNLTQKKKYTLYLLGFQLVLYFTHPYMGVISLFFIIVHQLFILFFDKKTRSIWFIGSTLAQSVLPMVIFQIYVIIIDKIQNRASYKFNFGTYNLDLKAVFYPHTKPFETTIKNIFNHDQLDWESWSYIGIVNIIFLGLIFFRFIFGGKKWLRIKNSKIILIGAFSLLHALGFFFKYGFGFLLDLIPQIRQIRVLSRFAWIFYFTAGVFVAIYFNKVFLKYFWERKKAVAYGLLIVVFSLNFWESFHYHSSNNNKMMRTKNPFILSNLSPQLKKEIKNIKANEFQAILALPFFQIGGDRSELKIRDHQLFFDVLALTYHTNVPLINTCLSRSSNDLISKVTKVITENYKEPELMRQFIKDGRKIALIKGKKPLNNMESRALSFSKKLNFSDRIFNFDFSNSMKSTQDSVISYYLKNKANLKQQGQLFFNKPNSQVIFETYDSYGNSTEIYFRGGNAMQSKFNKSTVLLDLKSRLKNTDYKVSFWYYNNMDTTNNIMFFVEDCPKGKSSKWTNVNDTRVNYKQEGNWSFVEFDVKIKSANGTKKLMFKGKNKFFDPPIFFDQLLIREKGVDVYWKYKNELFKNNYPVGKL